MVTNASAMPPKKPWATERHKGDFQSRSICIGHRAKSVEAGPFLPPRSISSRKWLHLTVGLPSARRNRKLAAAITTEPPKAERPYISTRRHNLAARQCARQLL